MIFIKPLPATPCYPLALSTRTTPTLSASKTQKANADKAMSAHCTDPYVNADNKVYKYTMASWDASAARLKAVQDQLALKGHQSVLLFAQEPKPDALGRLSRSKAKWLVVTNMPSV